MTGSRLIGICLVAVVMVGVFGSITYGEIHHVADCTVCHYRDCSDCANERFVRCEIGTPNSGIKDVAFSGSGSYVRGEAPYDGVCEVCHTATDYHTNTGDGATHFDGSNCIPCHPHRTDPDLFSPLAVLGLESHETHMSDNRGPGVGDCTVCHLDSANYSLFSDGEPLATTSACDTCHSPSGSLDGSQMAKANWEAGIYTAEGGAFQSGNEQWCGSCHDDEPANSKSDGSGVNAPGVIGDDTTYGFYVTGHGAHGIVDCLDCHVPNKSHIDHDHRTFEADEIEKVAVTNYSDSYRLPDHALKIPRTKSTIKFADFSLCLGCHSIDEVLYGDGTHTNFYDTHPVTNGINNGHTYHVTRNNFWNDTDWDRDMTDSLTTCIVCHNVHGPPNGAMLRHGELIGTDSDDRRPALNFTYLKAQPFPPATATYTATSLPAGDYEVYAWWVDDAASRRTPVARHTITHSSGSDEVLVNQRTNGGQWNLLGTYSYTEGATGTVVIDNEWYTDGLYIVADAIRWQQVTGGVHEVIVDNLDAVFTDDLSTWTSSSAGTQGWGSDYMLIEAHLPPGDPETTLIDSVGGDINYRGYGNMVCNSACHNTPAYEPWYRTPVLWPKVIYHPGPSVDAFPNDGSLFSISVTIVDPDDNVTGVTIDLSALGGPADGTMTDNLDGTYTYEFSVPVGTPDLLYTGSITATDADLNTGTYEFSEYVTDPDAIYIENTEAIMVPACEEVNCDPDVEWTEDAGMYLARALSYGHGGTHHIKLHGDGSGTATWPLSIPTGGNYEVYAWWNEGNIYWRSQEVTYTINHSAGSTPVVVNQEVNFDQWNLLGTFSFDAGTSGSVVLDDDIEPKNGQNYVVADAIKLVQVP